MHNKVIEKRSTVNRPLHQAWDQNRSQRYTLFNRPAHSRRSHQRFWRRNCRFYVLCIWIPAHDVPQNSPDDDAHLDEIVISSLGRNRHVETDKSRGIDANDRTGWLLELMILLVGCCRSGMRYRTSGYTSIHWPTLPHWWFRWASCRDIFQVHS